MNTTEIINALGSEFSTEELAKIAEIAARVAEKAKNCSQSKTIVEGKKNTAEKQYKTFAIGDGMKSIRVSDNYFAQMDENATLLLYTEADNVWIRISVITAEHKDKKTMFDNIVEKGRKENKKVEIIGDKSYIFSSKQYEEEGDQCITYFYETGYKQHCILISVTTLLENSETEEFKSALAEFPKYIASIEEISPAEKNYYFSLTNDDCDYINKRSAEILGITEKELDNFHENGETLKTIQKILDEEKFSAENTAELQSLGYAFGDYIQYKYPDLQWAILHDKHGRDFCLIHKQAPLTIFPATMILKRVEDGEKFDIEKLLNGILNIIDKEKDAFAIAAAPRPETPENTILAEFQEQLSGFSEEKREKINAFLQQIIENAAAEK
ncbi:MAG: DUF3806 domain-containing protein [Prevotellaceae bacterium]|jgi:hypothetical protein|nr:DUF3806 domain-containing protein [Prevotellaceae bacterium]